MDNKKRDREKFLIPEGDSNFSPQRNKKIIDDVIKKHEKNVKRKKKEFEDRLGERTQAASFYSLSRTSKPIDKYFGKKTFAYLRGDDIREEVQRRMLNQSNS